MEGGRRRREKRGEGRNKRGDCDTSKLLSHRLLNYGISGSLVVFIRREN